MTILFSRVVVEDGVVGELSVHVAVVGGGLGHGESLAPDQSGTFLRSGCHPESPQLISLMISPTEFLVPGVEVGVGEAMRHSGQMSFQKIGQL